MSLSPDYKPKKGDVVIFKFRFSDCQLQNDFSCLANCVTKVTEHDIGYCINPEGYGQCENGVMNMQFIVCFLKDSQYTVSEIANMIKSCYDNKQADGCDNVNHDTVDIVGYDLDTSRKAVFFKSFVIPRTDCKEAFVLLGNSSNSDADPIPVFGLDFNSDTRLLGCDMIQPNADTCKRLKCVITERSSDYNKWNIQADSGWSNCSELSSTFTKSPNDLSISVFDECDGCQIYCQSENKVGYNPSCSANANIPDGINVGDKITVDVNVQNTCNRADIYFIELYVNNELHYSLPVALYYNESRSFTVYSKPINQAGTVSVTVKVLDRGRKNVLYSTTKNVNVVSGCQSECETSCKTACEEKCEKECQVDQEMSKMMDYIQEMMYEYMQMLMFMSMLIFMMKAMFSVIE